MEKTPNLKFFSKEGSITLGVILPGANVGMDAPFIQKIINASREKGNSVVAFNFPFFDRGEEHSSGPELKEELETLRQVLGHCQAESFVRIRLIGKSLGGIVASRFLKNLPKEQQERYAIVILGYIVGEVDLSGFSGEITVIQGEKDKYGSIQEVKNTLASSNAKFFEIKGADHSYRDPETKEPIHEDKVIQILKES